jgi:hypothetical protein
MNENRKQTDYNKLVGRIDDEYYFLDYTFDDTLHGGEFKGATATVLRPVSDHEHEERISDLSEWFRDSWIGAVGAGETEDSLESWSEWIYKTNGDESIYDLSGQDLWPQLRAIGLSEDDYPLFECTGGGRSFSKNMKFDEVYNQELVDIINQFEK